MQLNTLETMGAIKKRRLGQGHGSGRGKTSGRGTKGQKARRNIKLSFEGGALPLIKRLPFRRGKGKNKSFRLKPMVVNLSELNALPKDTVVDIKTLLAHGIIMEKDIQHAQVKILGNGELTSILKVKLPVSNRAKEKIEKIGGTVEN